jgi:hypothetical protein
MAEFLNRNNIPVVAYVVTDSPDEQNVTGQPAGTTIVMIDPDAKLTEVL